MYGGSVATPVAGEQPMAIVGQSTIGLDDLIAGALPAEEAREGETDCTIITVADSQAGNLGSKQQDAADQASNMVKPDLAGSASTCTPETSYPGSTPEDFDPEAAIKDVDFFQHREKGQHIEDPELRDLLSFDSCEELLRGSRLGVIMSGRAKIFSSSEGDASTYALSRTVSRLGAFLSHNWCVSRLHKFLCLAFHFNCGFVLAGALAALSLSATLGYFRVLPDAAYFQYLGFERCFLARLLTLPVAVLVGLVGRECCPSTCGPDIFVDKVCVNQEDKQLQHRAMKKLSAFLRASDTLLICYTDVYLTKLWTVYEVASYLYHYPVSRVSLVHCDVPVWFLKGLAGFYVIDMLLVVIVEALGISSAAHVIYPVALLYIAHISRAIERSRQKMADILANFSVHNCTCHRESDRVLIHDNIVALARASHPMLNLTHSGALANFDAAVRNKLSVAMAGSFGNLGVQYFYMVGALVLAMAPRVADAVVGFSGDLTFMQWYVSFVLFYFAMAFTVMPLAWATVHYVSSNCLDRTGAGHYCIMFLGMTAGWATILLQGLLVTALESWALESEFGVFAFTVYVIVSSSCAWGLISLDLSRCYACHRRASLKPSASSTDVAAAGCPDGAATGTTQV